MKQRQPDLRRTRPAEELTWFGADPKFRPMPCPMPPLAKTYDVIVIGGGHAGSEAAAAAARLGARTLLLTHRLETIGEMSCNPAIGGLAKGQLVREVDALDGIMGRAIDKAGIQFRILNRTKGPAVQGPRAQADRKLYKQAIQDRLNDQPGLDILADAVEDLILGGGGAIAGVKTAGGEEIRARSVVVTTGTFLRGLIHIGADQIPAGQKSRIPESRKVWKPGVRHAFPQGEARKDGFPLGKTWKTPGGANLKYHAPALLFHPDCVPPGGILVNTRKTPGDPQDFPWGTPGKPSKKLLFRHTWFSPGEDQVNTRGTPGGTTGCFPPGEHQGDWSSPGEGHSAGMPLPPRG